MAKQVIEPQIVEPNQVIDSQENRQNSRAKVRFYHTEGSGCLGLIIFAFISVFVVLPSIFLSLFLKKK